MKRMISCAGALSLLVAQSAHADVLPSTLGILAEKANSNSKACGITDELILSAARAAIRYNHIKEVPLNSDGGAFVYMSVVTLTLSDVCASHIALSVRKIGFGPIEAEMSEATVNKVFCETGVELTAPLSDANIGTKVAQEIKDGLDRCLSQLTKGAVER